jgi:membrane-bound serine protease (ClpP class)
MKRRFAISMLCLSFLQAIWPARCEAILESSKVYVLPIRDDISPPMVYVVRRGVKEAMEARAELLVLDMETNGGRVDVTEESLKS